MTSRVTMTKNLTDRQREILREMPAGEWVRPMDIGGRDSSFHSDVLQQLCAKGFVERKRRNTLMNALGSARGSYVYRLVKGASK